MLTALGENDDLLEQQEHVVVFVDDVEHDSERVFDGVRTPQRHRHRVRRAIGAGLPDSSAGERGGGGGGGGAAAGRGQGVESEVGDESIHVAVIGLPTKH